MGAHGEENRQEADGYRKEPNRRLRIISYPLLCCLHRGKRVNLLVVLRNLYKARMEK